MNNFFTDYKEQARLREWARLWRKLRYTPLYERRLEREHIMFTLHKHVRKVVTDFVREFDYKPT